MTAAVLANEGGSRVRDRFLSRVARALERRDLDKARALGESLVAKDPGSSEARFALALAALLADDLAGAAALAVEAFEADPNVRETADLAAVVYGLAGDLTTAVYYGKLAAVIPASPRLAALLPSTLPTFARVLCEIASGHCLGVGPARSPPAHGWRPSTGCGSTSRSSRSAERRRSGWPCACLRKAARGLLPTSCVPPDINGRRMPRSPACSAGR
jgi:hypothetical protein